MKLSKQILLLSLSLLTFNLSGQWSEVDWPQMDGLSNIDFVNDETGYATMHELQGFTSSFEKTEDGGQTWEEYQVPVPSTDILDMDFNENGEGVLGTRSYIDGEILTQVYRTVNNGDTWEDVSPPNAATGFGMGAIQMLDANTIFFVIDNYLYRTVNGGQDWDSFLLPAAAVSVSFVDSDHGVVGTWDATFNYFGGMMATADGGETWNETVLDINNSVIGVVHQANETTAYAAPVKWGASGFSYFYKTVDNGENWTTISVPQTDDEATLTGLGFNSDGDMVISLSSFTLLHLFQSEDGGDSWDLQNELDFFYISDMELTTNSGYIVGEGGVIFRLNNPMNIQENRSAYIATYPNPVSTGQLLQWNSNANFTSIRVLSPSGTLVMDAALNAQQYRFPDLPSGVYVVQLSNKSETQSVRLVVR